MKEIVPCNPGRGEVGKKYHRLGNCGVGIFSEKVNMIGAPDSIQYLSNVYQQNFCTYLRLTVTLGPSAGISNGTVFLHTIFEHAQILRTLA